MKYLPQALQVAYNRAEERGVQIETDQVERVQAMLHAKKRLQIGGLIRRQRLDTTYISQI